MDEARHTEVFARYLDEKVGDAYPMNPFLEEQITALLEDSRWDIAYSACRSSSRASPWRPSATCSGAPKSHFSAKLLRYVMSDEARHVAFGVLTLREFYEG